MANYVFELQKPEDENAPIQYRLVHLGRFWNSPKNVYLTKTSFGTYTCSATHKKESMDTRFMVGDDANKLVRILKKQGLKNKKAMMSASFPRGTDQRAVNCWFAILNCLSFSGKH